MSHPTSTGDPVTSPREASIGHLVSDLSSQIPELIRSELRLAQAEAAEKGKRAGIGLGMFTAAGLLAFYAGGVLLAACVLALALVMPAWASAVVVAAVLLAVAGAAAVLGRNKVAQAAPLVPERAIRSVRQDVEAAKEARR